MAAACRAARLRARGCIEISNRFLETGGAASIILLDGRDKTNPAGQVASFRALQSSLMPEGLAALFSVKELRDLAAYLEQLR